MRGLKIISIVFGVIVTALWALGLLVGIWLPDVIFAPESSIAFAKTPAGHTFRVIQYWNRGDFYSTELVVAGPDGREQKYLLAADDSKSWKVPMSVDESNKVVIVTLGGGRLKKVSY